MNKDAIAGTLEKSLPPIAASSSSSAPVVGSSRC